MKYIRGILLNILFLIAGNGFSQSVEIIGEYKQGNLLYGVGEGIEYAFLDSTDLQVFENKYFVFAFDRDDRREHLLKIKLSDGRLILKKILPEESDYKIQRINNIKQKHVTPPREELDRISKEREVSRQARSTIGKIDTAYYIKGIVRPVKGGRISGVFGSQRILNGKPRNIHNGLDIAVPRGTPVYAMTDGVVKLAADTFYYAGNNILIDHGQGLNSFYLHLNEIDVEEGEFVKKGQKIGEVGSTGRSTGPHLHWGVQWYDKRIDPAILLKLKIGNQESLQ
ncbi:MAG: M23 family metallopeptidase [Melioribacteraceae bacterium]|nr:M23 family metallopeptidase [Melioribacteraceae bacterium]